MRTGTKVALLMGGAFTPAKLFRNGERGAWYDPSDLLSMYQDSTGATAAVVGQPVGWIGDKKSGLVRGSELVANGTFDSDISGWSASGAGAVSWAAPGYLSASDVAGADAVAWTTIACVAGRMYEAIFTIQSAGGQCQFWAGSGGAAQALQYNITSSTISTPTTFRVIFTASQTNGSVSFVAAATNTTTLVDSVSIREIAGSHAIQATSTARPTLAAGGKIDHDAVDDALVTTFTTNLGTDCTVARAVPGVGASILAGQTITTSYSDNADHCGLVIVNRSLTATETSRITRYLNRKAGV